MLIKSRGYLYVMALTFSKKPFKSCGSYCIVLPKYSLKQAGIDPEREITFTVEQKEATQNEPTAIPEQH